MTSEVRLHLCKDVLRKLKKKKFISGLVSVTPLDSRSWGVTLRLLASETQGVFTLNFCRCYTSFIRGAHENAKVISNTSYSLTCQFININVIPDSTNRLEAQLIFPCDLCLWMSFLPPTCPVQAASLPKPQRVLLLASREDYFLLCATRTAAGIVLSKKRFESANLQQLALCAEFTLKGTCKRYQRHQLILIKPKRKWL